jgi:hypothetical protein
MQYQRKLNRTTQLWVCLNCPERLVFSTTDDLWAHRVQDHEDEIPTEDSSDRRRYRGRFEVEGALKKYVPSTTQLSYKINAAPGSETIGNRGNSCSMRHRILG